MKKLMIAACAIAFAAVTQAASFSWGFKSDSIVGPEAKYNDGGYLYGGYAQLWIGDTLVAEGPQNDDYTFGSFNFTATDPKGKVQTLSTGDISETFVGQAYKLVLRTDDDKWEIVVNDTSKFQAVSQGVGNPDKNYETFVNNTAFAAGAWTQVVPEPTSGLLLLLGVAGLALKRKRS